MTGYVVYFTSDPVGAQDLTEAWPSPINGPHPVFLRNTTSRTLDDLPVLDGSTIYVEVVAWDSYGAGLVNASGPSTGMPEPLTVAFTPPPSGGPAPTRSTSTPPSRAAARTRSRTRRSSSRGGRPPTAR